MSPELARFLSIAQPNEPAVLEQFGGDHAIVGSSEATKQVMRRVDQVASTSATVLLLGETGTGKELVARAIHQRSARRHRGFVVVDCGSLPPTLIESELFGRERGAFTGADSSQPGRFELANSGTAFLDEIGELPVELQPKLLRVLQEGKIERLGGTRASRVDIRVIAATNRNLAEEVGRGRFRRDLFYRINVFPIALPPLRDRREDIPVLVHYLCARLGRRLGKTVRGLVPGSVPALQRHDWQGNIRELENVLQRAIIVSEDGMIDPAAFVGDPLSTDATPAREDRSRSLIDVERAHIRVVLEDASWRIEGQGGAANILGLPPSTLRLRMRKLGIARPMPELTD